MNVNALGQLTITTLSQGKLSTHRTTPTRWSDIAHALSDTGDQPTLLQLRLTDDALLYLMLDGDAAQLSAFHPSELCHYLVSGQPTGSNDHVDLGWNSYPKWMVVHGRERVLEIARNFVERRSFDPGAEWHEEVIDL